MATQDVMIGPGRLYIAPTGEANPDETTVAYDAAWGGNWVDLGDLEEGSGISLTINEEIAKVYGEQSTGVKKQRRTRREVLVKGSLQEHSVANWAYLLQGTAATTAAGASQKGYSDIPFGVQTAITEYKFGLEALRVDSAGVNQPVRWFLHKGTIRLTGDVAYQKQNGTNIPFEITVIEDGTQSAGEELGILQIVTAAATA